MKYLRKFDSTAEMTAAIQADKVSFLGLAQPQGQEPTMNIHVHVPVYPTNLVISCSNNTVTITATNATTIEYNTDGSSTYTTYTQPFEITETVTVYAKASTSDGSITDSQQCVYADPRYSTPFYLINTGGSNTTVQIKKSDTYAPTLNIEYSTNATNWYTLGTTSTTAITRKIGSSGSRIYLRCKTNNWGNGSYSSYYNFINVTSGGCTVGGNINSLLYGDDFNGQTDLPSGTTYNFYKLFYNNTRISNATDLLLSPTTLTNYCYSYMFQGCTGLRTLPVLPATALADGCYSGMFYGCKVLTTAPALPATTLANSCYSSMFQGCTGLTTPPVLPATTLAESCYYSMFYECKLTTAPALPATTLERDCYSRMFYNNPLTIAPVLPAATLVNYCYKEMFRMCSRLSYIECLATDISANNCTQNWVNGGPSTGTFVKNSSISSWTTGYSGIPEGWTVQDAQD